MNLISKGILDDKGYLSLHGGGKWKLSRGYFIMAQGKKSSSFYWMHAKVSKDFVNVVENDNAMELWHKRLGHMSEKGMSVFSKNEVIPGISDLHLQKCSHFFAEKNIGIFQVLCAFLETHGIGFGTFRCVWSNEDKIS